jgi:predicted nucleotidyltransferase
MRFGLTEREFGIVRDILATYPEVEQVVIYGSRAMGNFHSGSDLDLTLFGQNVDDATRRHIGSDLDESLLPYTVDLSIFHKLDNENLKDHIRRRGKVFYKNAAPANSR